MTRPVSRMLKLTAEARDHFAPARIRLSSLRRCEAPSATAAVTRAQNRWQSAIASASVASSASATVIAHASARRTMNLTCDLSARPWPATVSLTSVGVYSNRSSHDGRRGQHRHRARLAQAKRALHVGGDEAALQAHRVRRVFVDKPSKTVVDSIEAACHRADAAAPVRIVPAATCAGCAGAALDDARTR